MPFYQSRGKIPHKRHIQFRQPDGSLYKEELFSTVGFDAEQAILYHLYPPTKILQVGDPYDVSPNIVEQKQLKPRSILGFRAKPTDDYLDARKPVLVNNDCHISVAAPRNSMSDYFYRNADADEMIFVHQGKGSFKTAFGEIVFGPGDYIIAPRGTLYQMHFDAEDNRLLIVESFSPIRFPKRYLNSVGQFLEHSPFCERDIRTPQNLRTHDEQGEFKFLIKKDGMMYPYVYANHPFDLIGWDGYAYPFAFNIKNFEPLTGRIHMPPPIHQTFAADGFVVCSFVPRLYDYHPLSIPAPYNHSNIDSDEVLYYVEGKFMSRKHVEPGMFSLHPGGITHGPHPGAMEKSIGQKGTEETAVMVDTFKPLSLTDHALEMEDPEYYLSWLED